MENNFYSELKSKNDILEVAYSLDYNGKKTSNYFQGDCPRHNSEVGRCLVIWLGIQGWKCYHCGEKGDVINLVMHYKKCDHKTAVRFLADRAGIPYLGGKELTQEEIAQREKDIQEKILVEDMLTKAAEWYHERLNDYPDIKNYLLGHYGFSEEIIEELQIGFAPVSKKANHTSELADYLNSIPEFTGKTALTGLFSFSNQAYDYFKGRIVFPYWLNGKVVYQLARATTLTPLDAYECYTDKDNKLKLNDQGKPEFIKYKKLRSHNPDDEKKKYFSKFIQNDVFMGEDTIRGADEIIIAEGAPDWVSAVDKGFAAISPVTVRFREEDNEKLERLTQSAKAIYIINDNEENNAGFNGAIKTGKYLTEKGRNVFLVVLPRPEGVGKIDLNEYLKDHTADELRALMADAKSIIEILIEQLPKDFIKAQPYIKEEIAPLLTDIDEAKLHHYIQLLVGKTKTTAKAIAAEIEAARELKKQLEAKKEEIKIDPEIVKAAEDIANDPLLFKNRIDVINEAGIVGERKNIAMYFCAMDSRLLPDNFSSPNVLAVKNAGHFGAGKSHALNMCTEIYPDNAFYMITNGSAKCLYYLQGGLKNKAFIVTEAFQFQENNAADSEMVYVTRSLISEGRIRYPTVEKDKDGKLITVEKRLDGPTSFITTTIMENLEPQLEDRMFSIHPDEGIEQTKGILAMIANQKDGSFTGLDIKTIDTWKHYHSLLKPVEVVIPFAGDIAKFITKNKVVPLSTRRAFKRVLIVIQAVTCAYQFQRKKNDKGKMIAEISDYWMALQIVKESFRENMGAPDEKTEERVEFIKKRVKVLPKDIVKEFAVSSVSAWTTDKVKKGILSWCDESGNYFSDDKALSRAKHTGKAYLKINDDSSPEITGLPLPENLTDNPDWKKNGKLYTMYDLNLKNNRSNKVLSGVNQVFNSDLNTSNGDEPVNSIPKTDDETTAVKVFSEKSGKENKIYSDILEDDLCYEFCGILNDDNINKNTPPFICRKCSNYDKNYDSINGEVKEYCDITGKEINSDTVCVVVEPKETKLAEGVSTF